MRHREVYEQGFHFISCCFTRGEIRELTYAIKEHQKDANPKFDAVYIYDSFDGFYTFWVCYPQSETVRKYTGVPFR